MRYLFIIDDLNFSIHKVGPGGQYEFSDDHDDSKKMWLAYFFDAGEKMDRLEKIQEELTFSVLQKLAFAALILAFLIGIVQIINAQKRAKRMTKQIIYLYETLEEVVKKRKPGTPFSLTYHKSSKELNELHLTFNQVANTLSLATDSLAHGEETNALLNYSKLYCEFGEFDENHKHRGTCMSNIGSIMASNRDYIKAEQCFSLSIENQLNSHVGF